MIEDVAEESLILRNRGLCSSLAKRSRYCRCIGKRTNKPFEIFARHNDVRNGEGKAESEASDDEDMHYERLVF